MWQSINNGNWKSVESTVRRLASLGGDLDVWTGGIDTLRLEGRQIHLARDKKNNSKWLVPVPKLLFKLVQNRGKNEALAFVTANNPYLDDGKSLPNDYKICKEYAVCGEKFPNFKKAFEGYTYCCRHEDFFKSNKVRALKLPVDLGNAKPMTLH